jgi:hypothetical protein
MIVFERRASTILFNLLNVHTLKGPFLLPANICPIVPMVFHKAQRSFEFVDIAPNTLCMDHKALVERWSQPYNKPAGIVYVRTYGAIFDATDIFSVIKNLSPQAMIVDDRCLCPPSFDRILTPHVDVALFSTGYAKYADIGFGGFGVISDDIPYTCTSSAFNAANLDDLTFQYKQALRTQQNFSYINSDWLDMTKPQETWISYQNQVEQELIQIRERKKAINLIYSDRLSSDIQFPSTFQSWRFNIHVQEKKSVLDAIYNEGLFASGHYDSLAGIFGRGNAPFAKKLHCHVINLFNDRYFSENQAIKLTDLLSRFKSLASSQIFL